MDLFTLVVFMLVAVLISVIVNECIPNISTPLIQIILGVVISFFATADAVSFDTDLFLILFISPILFDDGFKLDKRSFWELKWPILSLALGLVFVIVLITGFLTNAIIPSIPLAAAFAFAAALGPTDPVAVAALTSRVRLSDRQKTLFTGEALLNDASSLVSFQFALAALSTGAFSLFQATMATIISFCGGIVVGVAFMWLRGVIVQWVKRSGLEHPVVSTIFEIITPFLVFLIAEIFSVSEIIAVVAAGIMYSLSSNRQRAVDAETEVVSGSVWNTLTFVLNSFVFVLMGVMLPNILPRVWVNSSIPDWRLILFVVAITAILYVVRFAWLLLIKTNDVERKEVNDRHYLKERLRSTLIMTLGGAKGVVTFAIAISLPHMLWTGEAFPERELILFLASGVILLTLLVANFVMPLIVPKEETELDERMLKASEAEAVIEAYNRIIMELGKKRTDDNGNAINSLVSHYRRRIRKLRAEHDIEPDRHITLNLVLISWEMRNVYDMVLARKINPLNGYSFILTLAKTNAMITGRSMLIEELKTSIDCFKHFKQMQKSQHQLKKSGQQPMQHWPRLITRDRSFSDTWISTTHEIRRCNRENAIMMIDAAMLDPSMSSIATEKELLRLKASYQNRVLDFAHTSNITKLIPGQDEFIFARYTSGDDADLEDFAIRLERTAIRKLEDSGKLSKESARMLRNDIAMQELDIGD